ncbi:hypothetical protein LTR56_002219 [Elasticomyces elasticus]|nr:hypothetical protein LTR56_002219 [Elasticomyces elasticus]KAK3666099.1 hypothetical protein LTR22_003102 [Elasticomyces elasticus]KAK4929586.1 hypothetical protein LTR49_003881 [Elasticomyces elasticus]KAK5767457.1 hypothetical protein LTS12_002298 [Elasticomyces elasticus]
MSGWDTSPAAATDDGFKADDTFQADGAADGGEGLQFADENISRHAEGPADGGCGDPQHFRKDCPTAPASNCYNCGQEGHYSSDCPEPKVEREAQPCRVCSSLEHKAAECDANKLTVLIAGLDIKDMPAEDAWKMLEAADTDKDVDDIKTALLTYAKAYPSLLFEELEQVFRDAEMNTHLIAKQQEVGKTHTIVNLQGKEDQEYVVSIQFSAKPRRAAFADGYPSSQEENLTRLAKAGFPVNNFQQVCKNCDEVGHTSKRCEQEPREVEKPKIVCQLCNEPNHYARDCPSERKAPGKKGCRNCGSLDHQQKDCEEPPNMDNVVCKECEQTGHFAKDCLSKPCYNCGEPGHKKPDCTAPRKKTDWSKVECSICHEMGHSHRRCPQAAAEGETGGDGGFGDGAAAGGDASGGW